MTSTLDEVFVEVGFRFPASEYLVLTNSTHRTRTSLFRSAKQVNSSMLTLIYHGSSCGYCKRVLTNKFQVQNGNIIGINNNLQLPVYDLCG